MSRAPDRQPAAETIEVWFQVEPGYDGWRLDHYLTAKIKRLSRNRIGRIIRGPLTLNGVAVRKPGVRLRRGDSICIHRPWPEEPAVPRHFTVLAEDADYLAVDKPAGLPVHPTARYLKNTLTALIRERWGEDTPIRLAHRLDRETSGVVLLGRHPPAVRRLKAAFRDGRVEKRYLALVHGDLRAPREIDLALGPAPDSRIRIKMGVRSDGLPARTQIRPLRRFADHTLVEARPLTGRQHQIRVHLHAIGHPVVGDKLYGQGDAFFLALVEHGLSEDMRRALELPRHALHAAWIRFPLPDGSGRSASVVAPLPEDLISFMARLGPGEATPCPTPG